MRQSLGHHFSKNLHVSDVRSMYLCDTAFCASNRDRCCFDLKSGAVDDNTGYFKKSVHMFCC